MSKRQLFLSAIFVLFVTQSLHAAVVTKINDDALAPLRQPGHSRRIVLDKLPLYDAKRSMIELEEFRVWTPDGKVYIHGDGETVAVDPPKARYFRGLVNGDLESFAVFTVDEKTKAISGLIVTRDKRYAIDSVARRRAGSGPQHKNTAEETAVAGVDVYLSEATAENMIAGSRKPFWCELDKIRLSSPDEPLPTPRATGIDGLPVIAQGITGTQQYEVTLEIETDYEFYVNAESDSTTATNYITNLTAAVSTIYNRDLNINVLQDSLHLYTVAGDPWSQLGLAGMNELAAYYHSGNRPAGRTTSAVTMLSGRDYGGGIAYEGIICKLDDATVPYAGPYSWSAGIGRLFGEDPGLGDVPDPDATNGQGTPHGTPPGLQNYWPLIVYAHELGHNVGGHHTHCTETSDLERIASGFTDGSAATSANNQVDHCYGDEDAIGLSNCFVGANYVDGSQSIFKGTIMSYCHNVGAPDLPQSRFIFGADGEPSQHAFDDYLLRASGPLQFPAGDGRDGGGRNIVNGIGTFTMTLTAPAEVISNSTGNAASIATANPGTGTPAWAWSITNGTITGGDGTNAITFTAGASGEVILKASAYKGSRCGITESRAIAITTPFTPPTNVVATATGATSVNITWDAVDGATQYQVFRASTQGSFGTLVGTSVTTSLTDLTAAENTAYQYVVTAGDGISFSTFSDDDLAVTVVYTDPTLTTLSTTVKLAHFNQLLTAVNAVNTLVSLAPVSFSSPTPAVGVKAFAVHVNDLRAAVNTARGVLGYTPLTYTDPTLTVGSTKVKAAHLTELRNGVK